MQRSLVQRQAEILAEVAVSEMSLGEQVSAGRRGSATVPRRMEVEKHSLTKLVRPLLLSQEYQRHASPGPHWPDWEESEGENFEQLGLPWGSELQLGKRG